MDDGHFTCLLCGRDHTKNPSAASVIRRHRFGCADHCVDFVPSGNHSFSKLFSASIAFTFVLSLSGIAVHSAPIVHKRDLVQACTGPNGSGECVVLNVAAQDASLAAGCTNVSGISSLIMNVDDDCVSFP
ncbi:hypothetical protein B0H10DRAFT_274975 [Mycena sp. CBHHK59/15]|nr:hypothetical protein B0H10DRAFT_274975 [Mycena sp. CBHHK59/15]